MTLKVRKTSLTLSQLMTCDSEDTTVVAGLEVPVSSAPYMVADSIRARTVLDMLQLRRGTKMPTATATATPITKVIEIDN